GTLYRALPVKAAMAGELVLYGRNVVPTLQKFRSAHEILRKRGHTSDDPYRAQIAHVAHELQMAEEAVALAVKEWMHERPGRWIRRFLRHGLIGEIRGFRERGGKTALVSDYPARTKLAGAGISDLFDHV